MITPSRQFVIQPCLYLFSITSPLPWLHIWSLLFLISLLGDCRAFPTLSQLNPKPPSELTGGSLSHLPRAAGGVFTELLGSDLGYKLLPFWANGKEIQQKQKIGFNYHPDCKWTPFFGRSSAVAQCYCSPQWALARPNPRPAAVWKCIDLFFKAKEPITASQPAEYILYFHLQDSLCLHCTA